MTPRPERYDHDTNVQHAQDRDASDDHDAALVASGVRFDDQEVTD